MFFLMIMTIFGGSMLNWLMFLNPKMIMLPKFMKLLTLIVCLLGGLIGYVLNYMFLLNSNIFVKYNLKLFAGMMWFMPLISTLFIIKFPLKLGLNLYKSFDQGWSEYFGGQMLYNQMKKYSLYIQEFQNNNLKIYLMSYFIWIIILLIMMFLN